MTSASRSQARRITGETAARGVVGLAAAPVDPGGRLDVRHVADPGRSIFQSAAGAPLEAARVALDVSDRQGSFQVGQTELDRCRAPRLDALRAGGGRVVLSGAFDDAGCAGLERTLELCQEAGQTVSRGRDPREARSPSCRARRDGAGSDASSARPLRCSTDRHVPC